MTPPGPAEAIGHDCAHVSLCFRSSFPPPPPPFPVCRCSVAGGARGNSSPGPLGASSLWVGSGPNHSFLLCFPSSSLASSSVPPPFSLLVLVLLRLPPRFPSFPLPLVPPPFLLRSFSSSSPACGWVSCSPEGLGSPRGGRDHPRACVAPRAGASSGTSARQPRGLQASSLLFPSFVHFFS